MPYFTAAIEDAYYRNKKSGIQASEENNADACSQPCVRFNDPPTSSLSVFFSTTTTSAVVCVSDPATRSLPPSFLARQSVCSS